MIFNFIEQMGNRGEREREEKERKKAERLSVGKDKSTVVDGVMGEVDQKMDQRDQTSMTGEAEDRQKMILVLDRMILILDRMILFLAHPMLLPTVIGKCPMVTQVIFINNLVQRLVTYVGINYS